MPIRNLALFVACVVAGAGVCGADTYTTFDANGIFSQGTLSGTATLDDSTWTFSSADLTVSYLGTNYVFSGTPTANPFGMFDGFELADAQGDTIELYFPVSTFVGYSGGPFCDYAGNCSFGVQTVSSEISGGGSDPFATVDPLYGGGLTAVTTPTPEASAVWLLATGLACVSAGARRRRA